MSTQTHNDPLSAAAASAIADSIEEYIGCAQDREDRFASLCSQLSKLIKAEDFSPAAGAIARLVSPDLDYTSMQSLVRLFHRCRGRLAPQPQKTSLAILGSFTTQPLAQMIELFLYAAGVDVEFYESDYGTFRQEIIDPASGLYPFKPASVLIATTWRDLTGCPAISDDAQSVQDRLASELSHWSSLWQTLHSNHACQIIQNNFDFPAWPALANHELRHPASAARFIADVNRGFQASAPPFVTIHDVETLSSSVGRRKWADEHYFHQAKLPCAPECLVAYAHSLASLLIAQIGLSKKCLVLDLDNTLWGGVIGDDGLGGIRIGQGSAEGEGFLAVQRWAKRLKDRGVILAVCSKNTDAVAREVFERHTEMALKLEDISCFVANWNDKAANIRAIAQELNIGLQSLVFLDDNPAERAIVRRLLPEVAVPEVTGDPLDFIDAVERHRYFQLVSLGKEDLQRTEFYQSNAQRRRIESSSDGISGFLQSLQMTAHIGPITDISLERATQLINKSNQFNLTTIRRSAAQVLALSRDPQWITLTASLNDRFGDNGLISVLLAQIIDDGTNLSLDIDTWLMSCRVLKRNVEQLLLNALVSAADARGIHRITASYIPTSKNALVKDHYSSLGFNLIEQSDDGRCRYDLSVTQFTPRQTFIELKEAA